MNGCAEIRRRWIGGVALIGIVAAAVTATAADKSWTGDGDGTTWSDGNNWGGTAPASGDDITLPTDKGTLIDVDSDVTVGSLRIIRNISYILTNHTITIQPSGRWYSAYGKPVDIVIDENDAKIWSDLELGGDTFVLGNTTGTGKEPMFFGSIGDGGGGRHLTLWNGNNCRLYLYGSNTFSGGLTFEGKGRFFLRNANAMGTGPVTIKGTPYLYANPGITNPAPLHIESSFFFERYTASGTTLAFTGPITLTNATPPVSIQVQGAKLVLDGDISETGGAATLEYSVMASGGSLRLGGSNTFSGGMTVLLPENNCNGEFILAHRHALPGGLFTLKGYKQGNSITVTALEDDIAIPNDILITTAVAEPVLVFRGRGSGTLSLTGDLVAPATNYYVQAHSNTTLGVTGAIRCTHLNGLMIGNANEGNAALSPAGEGTGAFAVDGNLSFRDSTTARFEVDIKGNVPGVSYDRVTVTNGTIKLRTVAGSGARLVARLGGEGAAPEDRLFILVNNGAGAINYTFDGLAEGATVDLGTPFGAPASCTIGYAGDAGTGATSGGNDVVLYDFVNAAPPRGTLVIVR